MSRSLSRRAAGHLLLPALLVGLLTGCEPFDFYILIDLDPPGAADQFNPNLPCEEVLESELRTSDLSRLGTECAIRGNLIVDAASESLERVRIVHGSLIVEEGQDGAALTALRRVDGDATVRGAVDGLGALTNIGGALAITDSSLTNLDGLSGLQSVGGSITLARLAELVSLDGLSGLTAVNGELRIENAVKLPSMRGLHNVTYVSDALLLSRNNTLSDLTGLDSLERVGQLQIAANTGMTALAGAPKLARVDSSLTLSGNSALVSSGDLRPLTLGAQASVNVDGCTRLVDVNLLQGVTDLASLTLRGLPQLANVDGLSALRRIAGNLVLDNVGATHLTGLTALESVQQFQINRLSRLTGITGFSALDFSTLSIQESNQLTEVDGFNGVKQATAITLSGGSLLVAVKGFASLETLGTLTCTTSNGIERIEGFDSLQTVNTIAVSCSQLSVLDPLTKATTLGVVSVGGTSLASIENDHVTSVTSISIHDTAVLTEISFPAVATIASFSPILRNEGLTRVSFPSLRTAPRGLRVCDNPNLPQSELDAISAGLDDPDHLYPCP